MLIQCACHDIVLTMQLLRIDMTGSLPKCHVPARFVVLIPREFPASNIPSSTDKKRASASKQVSPSDPKPANKRGSKKSDDTSEGDLALNHMITEMAYGGFGESGGGMDYENFDFS